MSRYAVSLDVAEDLKKEQELLKQQEAASKEEDKKETAVNSEETNENLQEKQTDSNNLNQNSEPASFTPELENEETHDNQGFFSFMKNHKFIIFVIALIILGYFYMNNNDIASNDSNVNLQDVAQLNLQNKNKSAEVLADILTNGLTAVK